jgi:hypothetical protein
MCIDINEELVASFFKVELVSTGVLDIASYKPALFMVSMARPPSFHVRPLFQCLSILVQHGATPEVRHKPTGCACCVDEAQEKVSHGSMRSHQSAASLFFTETCHNATPPWIPSTSSLLQASPIFVRFEFFTAVTMKNGVFLDVNAVWLL